MSIEALSGQQIGNYEFIEEIGSGGFGAVYRARESTVDREVAIKVILPEHANKPEFKQRFESEARLVAKLEHPHIIPLYSFWQDERGAFLVMRYVQGGSLRDILKRQGALSLAQTSRITGHIAEALTIAHESGVIHRDLKPENILLDRRGNAYLTDFGIAKQTDSQQNITATDAVVGTMAYLSPEQLGGGKASPGSDIYALGIMLYEMLAGEHPFAGSAFGAMVAKHLQEPVPLLSEKRPDLPPELDVAIARSTAKSPEERYSSAQGLVDEIAQSTGESIKIQVQPAAMSVQIEKEEPTSVIRRHVTPTTPEGRNRHAMLQNVRKFWVEGVLENSLRGAAMIELGMSEADAVDSNWNLLLRTSGGEDQMLPTGTRIRDVFDKLNGKLLILGDPGAGKTTTLLDLARDLLDRAEMDDAHPIPVVFNLSSWGEERKPLAAWLVDELNGKYHVPRRFANEWIDHDALLLLLDGLDEVLAEYRDACVEATNNYRAEHGFVDVVVCSRIKDYEALTNQLQLNGAVLIRPLEEVQIDEYLSGLGTESGTLRRLLGEDSQLRELAYSPLMLNVMAMVFKSASASDIPMLENVEDQRRYLFEKYVQRMFDRRLGERSYSQEQTTHYLSWLAKRMTGQARSIFNLEDLQPDWLKVAQQTRYYRMLTYALILSLSLLSIVVYFPYHVTRKPTLILAVAGILMYAVAHAVVGWVFSTKHIGRPISYVIGALGFGIISGLGSFTNLPPDPERVLAIAIPNTLFSALGIYTATRIGITPDRIKPIDTLRFSRQAVKLWMVFVGFIIGVFFGQQSILEGMIVSGLLMAILVAFMGGLVNQELSTRSQPNQGIWSSHKNGIRFVPVMGLLSGLTLTAPSIIGGEQAIGRALLGFGAGVMMSLYVYLMLGGYAALQHYVIRRVLHRDGAIPYNYARFLDYAASLILLRKVGGGYIFIHRYLLEYFADLGDQPAAE